MQRTLAGLFSEYHLYRELMAQAVLRRPDNTLDAAAVRRVLDLIHLRYMVRHAPDGALAFIADQKMSGVPFEEYWPRPEIHQPLYETACIGTSAPAISPSRVRERGRFGLERTYNLHPNFSAPLGTAAPAQAAIMDLLHSLERLPTGGSPRLDGRARLFVRASVERLPHQFGSRDRHGVGAALQLQRCPLSPGFAQCHLHPEPAAGRGHRARRRLDRQQLGDYRRLRAALPVCPHSQERDQSRAALLDQSRTRERRVATSSYGRRQTIC